MIHEGSLSIRQSHCVISSRFLSSECHWEQIIMTSSLFGNGVVLVLNFSVPLFSQFLDSPPVCSMLRPFGHGPRPRL